MNEIFTELSAFLRWIEAKQPADLLDESSVQADLALTRDEASDVQDQFRTRLRVVEDEQRTRLGGGYAVDFGSMSAEQKRDYFSETAKAAEAGLNELLTPVKATRLRQITRQVKGPMAFSDTDVAQRLALTRDQRDALKTIQAEYREDLGRVFKPPEPPGGMKTMRFGGPGDGTKSMGPPGHGGRGGHDGQSGHDGPPGGPGGPGGPPSDGGPPGGRGGPADWESRFKEAWEAKLKEAADLRRAAVEEFVAMLTPPQVAVWEGMVGRPFEGNVMSPSFGGFGRGRPFGRDDRFDRGNNNRDRGGGRGGERRGRPGTDGKADAPAPSNSAEGPESR